MEEHTLGGGSEREKRDHNMKNTTVIWDVKFSGLTEKTATFEMKQSTKRPRHYVPENHNLHIHCYLNLKSQNTVVTGTQMINSYGVKMQETDKNWKQRKRTGKAGR